MQCLAFNAWICIPIVFSVVAVIIAFIPEKNIAEAKGANIVVDMIAKSLERLGY